jgi:MFS family permease
LVQAAASAVAGGVTARLGPAAMLRIGWLAGAAVFVALAFVSGPWLIAVGLAFGVLAGLTEGAEKTWLAERAPREERALTFGAMALVSAGSALLGNALCGWLLMVWGPQVFAVAAVIAVAGAVLTIRK